MEELLSWQWSPQFQKLATEVFFWIGYAILVGLATRFIFRSRAFQTPWLTLLLGIIGTTIGPLVVRSVFSVENFNPLSPVGMIASLLFALVASLFCSAIAFLFPQSEDDSEYGLQVGGVYEYLGKGKFEPLEEDESESVSQAPSYNIPRYSVRERRR